MPVYTVAITITIPVLYKVEAENEEAAMSANVGPYYSKYGTDCALVGVHDLGGGGLVEFSADWDPPKMSGTRQVVGGAGKVPSDEQYSTSSAGIGILTGTVPENEWEGLTQEERDDVLTLLKVGERNTVGSVISGSQRLRTLVAYLALSHARKELKLERSLR